MIKGILALAVLSVLTAGDAVATSGPNPGVTSVSGTLSRAVHDGPVVAVEQPAAPSLEQTASATVKGHAPSMGPSTPQPLSLPASTEPAARTRVPLAQHQPCPAVQHLGIVCIAP